MHDSDASHHLASDSPSKSCAANRIVLLDPCVQDIPAFARDAFNAIIGPGQLSVNCAGRVSIISQIDRQQTALSEIR